MAASHYYPPEFWNALSKITLTRRALKEFDRRTTKEKTPAREAKRSTLLLRSDREKLLHFVKNRGPNLNHLRGYAYLLRSLPDKGKPRSRKRKRTRNTGDSSLPSSQPTEKTSTTSPSSPTGSSSITSPYNSQFQQILTDRGVFPEGYEDLDGNISEPVNIDSLRERLLISHSSLSPSRFTINEFKDFQRANRKAKSESKVLSTIIPIIIGVEDSRFETEGNIMFKNIKKFALNLKIAKPNKYYGARPEQVDKRVRRDLDEYIVPSADTTQPVLPNFFLESKGTKGRPDIAELQAMYDNANGARAMFQIQNYRKETPTYDGNAYTIGASYCSGVLKLYATHPRQSTTGRTEYYMTQLGAYAMTHSVEICRQGITAYRNARDFTKEQRDLFIAEANKTSRSDSAATDRKAHPRKQKRTAQAASTVPRLRSSTRGPTPNVQARNTTIHENKDERRARDHKADSNNGDDEDCVTADGEQDGDEDEDEDEDDIHAATHGPSIPNKAASASPRSQSQSAWNTMTRLLKQGHSQGAAFNQLVAAHQQSKRVSRRVAIREVRAKLMSGL